jgi:hypothetical protein
MTKPTAGVPDWLAERVALDEVPAACAGRVERADPGELAAQVAALRADDARERAAYPAGPAVAQLLARAGEQRRRTRAARMRGAFAMTAGVAAVVIVAGLALGRGPAAEHRGGPASADDGTRVKGRARLLAFRQVGAGAEQLDADAVVRAGDVIQLRYNAGGQRYGFIASIDGAGAVTLHFPADAAAPPEATAVAAGTIALPSAYQLDDAPGFERFFFVTAGSPIDVAGSLDALRGFAHRADAADADLALPVGMQQASLRLRKPAPADSPADPSRGTP